MEKTYIDSVNETPREAVMRLYGAIGPRVDGDYFAQAVAWANEHDITDGVGGGLFGSMDSCTRSQIVTFLFMAR